MIQAPLKGAYMHRKSLFLALVVFSSVVTVWAGGRKENESHDVGDLSGFTEAIDTSEKKPGKYNLPGSAGQGGTGLADKRFLGGYGGYNEIVG
jgi:hypothetical protein